MSDRWETDALTDLVGRKLRALLQLRELTARQPALIAEEDTPTLLRVFAAKQTLLDEIRRLDEQLEPFRHQAPESRVWRSPEHQARCRLAAEQCRRLVEEIKATEVRDRDALVARRTAVACQLDAAHAAAAARSAYRPAAASGGFEWVSET